MVYGQLNSCDLAVLLYNMLMKLYLIRHSKTKFEPETPNEQWVLDDVGTERAEAFARKPEIADLEIVYTSMQLKALATGLKIAELLRIPMRPDHGLTELTSITRGFIPNYDDAVADLYAGKVDKINDGETLAEGLVRFNETVVRIVSAHPDLGRIGLVAHCNILSLFASQYEERTAHELHSTMGMPDLAILDWQSRTFTQTFGQ